MTAESRWRENKTLFERNKFFASTTLAGFGFIQKSNSKIEILFWYIIISLFITVTVINTILLTTNFASKPTVTTVTMGKLNDSYRLRSFRLALKFALPELNPEYACSERYALQKFKNNYKISLSDEIDRALEQLNTREKWRNSVWDYALLPLLSRYVSHLSTCEYRNSICNSGWHQFPEFEIMTQSNLTVIRDQVLKVLNHTRKLQIPDPELFKLLGKQIMGLTRIHIANPKNMTWNTSLLYVINAHFTYGVLFAYELTPINPIKLGYQNGIHIFADIKYITNVLLQSEELGPNATLEDAHNWFSKVPPLMEVELGENNKRMITGNIDESHHWTIQVASEYHSIKNCLSDVSHKQCVLNCMSQAIRQQCKCNTVTLPVEHVENNIPWCDADRYNVCMENMRIHTREQCTNECPSECDVEFLDIETIEQNPISLKSFMFHVSINVLNKDHPVFQETYAQSWSSYLAEIGGTIDFWLGASVLALIHVIVYFGKQAVYAFGKDTTTGHNIRQMSMKIRGKKLERKSEHTMRSKSLSDDNDEMTQTEISDMMKRLTKNQMLLQQQVRSLSLKLNSLTNSANENTEQE